MQTKEVENGIETQNLDDEEPSNPQPDVVSGKNNEVLFLRVIINPIINKYSKTFPSNNIILALY